MGLRWPAWITLVGLTSCSLLTPLDGLTGGGDAPGEGGGTGEGGTDAAVPPEDGSRDAQGDANPRPDGGISCATLSPAPRLCVDFRNEIIVSTGTPTATSFERAVNTTAPVPTIDRDTFDSPSAAARFTFTTSSSRSYLQRAFTGATPSNIAFSMAMRFDPSSDDIELDLMEIRFGNDAGLFLRRRPGGTMELLTYSGNDPFNKIPVPGVMRRSAFATYAWVIDLTGMPTLSMSIDGEEVVTRAPIVGLVTGTTTTFIAGCTDYYANAASTLWVDDVVVRF